VHLPLGDEDEDILDYNLNNLNMLDELDANDDLNQESNLGLGFNKTLKNLDLKAMTLKNPDTDSNESGSEDDRIVSDRNLD